MIHLAILVSLAAVSADDAVKESTRQIEVSSALIKLIEQVDVPAEESGVLMSVAVREGQMVKEGDELARLVDREASLAAVRAGIEVVIAKKNSENDINIRFAKKSVDVAKAELRRALESIEEYPKSISESEMDHTRLTVERTILEVEQAERDFEIAQCTRQIKENELEFARLKLSRRTITAPISGVVVQVNRRQGEWVEPGDTVLRILRMDRLRAEGFVHIKGVPRNLQDCRATLHVDLPDQPGAKFPGKVVFLSPEIDPVNAQIRVWAEIENREFRLRPGMRARMTIDVSPTSKKPE